MGLYLQRQRNISHTRRLEHNRIIRAPHRVDGDVFFNLVALIRFQGDLCHVFARQRANDREGNAHGFPGNVAVGYEISFHRYLQEGDRAHHYTTVVNITELKRTALGEGYFVTERVEYLDQDDNLFAEALITYFQYRPAAGAGGTENTSSVSAENASSAESQGVTEPVSADIRSGDLQFADLSVDQALPELAIPITHKLIVGGAIATQDFIDVHHNAPAARAAAMPDIFMNILTTCGLCARYLSDWAGPASRLQKLKLKLLAPNLPGDTMIMQGRVVDLGTSDEGQRVSVEFAGRNGLGFHVTGAATLRVG